MIIGNWKMNTSREAALALSEALVGLVETHPVSVGVCPPMIWLDLVCQHTADSGLWVGAQDVIGDPYGALTGCVNAQMVLDAGAGFALLGHSERRARFSETTESVLPAVGAMLELGLFAVVCVGENQTERESGQAFAVVESQLAPLLASGLDLSGVVIAYEPVWAIGTGLAAEPADIGVMHRWIREVMGRDETLVLYGGSVTAEMAPEIFALSEVSGALVGGASLHIETFAAIVTAWEQREWN